MATINTETFCDRAAENYGWDAPKIARLRHFLAGEHVQSQEISLEKLASVLARFLAAEISHKPPPDAPLTDTS